MSSAGSFQDYIRARDAAGLHFYMTIEHHLRHTHHRQRNNLYLFEACRDGAVNICEVLISFGSDMNSAPLDQQTPLNILLIWCLCECV